MKLKGEAQMLFKEWYTEIYLAEIDLTQDSINFLTGVFNIKRKAEQWGVYLEFADSLNIYISVYQIDTFLKTDNKFVCDRFGLEIDWEEGTYHYDIFKSRKEAQQGAIEKLNGIINK